MLVVHQHLSLFSLAGPIKLPEVLGSNRLYRHLVTKCAAHISPTRKGNGIQVAVLGAARRQAQGLNKAELFQKGLDTGMCFC